MRAAASDPVTAFRGTRQRPARWRCLPLALLVGLAAPDRDAEAVLGLFEVRHVQRDELRRAEGAGEAEQQGRATAGALQGVGVACAIALAVSARMDALRTLAAP